MSQNDVDEADTAVFWDKREIMIWIFGEIAKISNRQTALVTEHGRVRLVDVVLGQLSWFLNSFGVNVRYLLNFGRGPSQNPQKLTLLP